MKHDDKFIDLTQVISNSSYYDWEGLADPKEAVKLTAIILTEFAEQLKEDRLQEIADIVCHFCYSSLDLADEICPEEMFIVTYTIMGLLNTRYWMKSGVQWKYNRETRKIEYTMPDNDDEQEV